MNDILEIRLNMPPVSEVDLRPAVREFLEKSREVDIDVQKHRQQHEYIGFFSEVKPAKTKVKTAKNSGFEDEYTLMDELVEFEDWDMNYK